MKKGFTLIELLAVIVILAIIALIASPIVIGLIEDARVEAAERSMEAAISAAKSYYATETMKSATGTSPASATYDKLKMDNAPTAGTFTYDADGNVTATGVKFGDYTCSYSVPSGKTAPVASCSK